MRCTQTLPRLLTSALLLIAVAVTAQDAPLAPFQADYDVLRNGKSLGSSRAALSRDGDTWRYVVDTVGERGMAWMVGLKISQSHRFRWRDGLPQPLASDYEQEATLGNRSVTVRYDWAAGRYHLSDRKGEHEHALSPDAVDRYGGSSLAVSAQLAAGVSEFTLKVAYPDGLRDWRFRSLGEESVETAAGRVSAIKVERIHDGDDDRSTVSWHDPARDYVIVRMIQVEDGDSTETRLRSYSRG